jgi:CubicO group peptidase (beta-lactamase class C family)
MNRPAFSALTAFLESWLTYRSKHVDIPGFSVAVQADDTVVFSKAFGVAETVHNTPLTTGHQFAVASQTKMFTAIAILQLVEAGSLVLDKPVCTYLPWLATHADLRVTAITIRHLLQHSSGLIRDGKNDYWVTNTGFPDKAAIHAAVLASDLMCDPGSQLKYSNLGYALLGELISVESSMSYEAYIKAHILQPLDNKATFKPDKDRIPTGYGLAFRQRRKPLKSALNIKALSPVTGLYASPSDMCKFVAALSDGQETLLTEASKHTMRESIQSSFGYDYGTAFGLGLEMHTIAGHSITGHSGHISANLTATLYDPKSRLSVAVGANAKDAPCVAMARGILGALYYFLEHEPQASQATPFAVRVCNDLSTLEIVQSGESIVIIDPDDWEPFAMPETAERLDDTTLRITTYGSIFNFGELIKYTFSGKRVDYIRFAGMKIFPDNS